MNEASLHEENCFITLTYDAAHLPANRSLDVKHWQLFAKRMRKAGLRFRFYHVGEYGDEKGRPHYHACIFGQDFQWDRQYYSKTDQGHTLYTSATLTRLWRKGEAWIGNLTFESAAYVARYIMKKAIGGSPPGQYESVDQSTGEVFANLKPEYSTMSRNKGIGHKWIQKYMDDVFPSDEVIVAGRATRPPLYYLTQLEKADPALFKIIKARRETAGSDNYQDNTPERLRVKETVKKAATQNLKRSLT